ncbi:tRNA (adenosine(37)-N6)-threonylcarbamoyltransferase complex dimerization subunit type 1 TsaB [Planktotalea sp.]|uniref:tRNA (adenosine(37)-N6)-threonylcarbamoyltransferase complex dimerization subunit type 1 TsaB n=1 Tax=Planktotalea sp. TaxID=2029877 RepID=UPI003D6C3152
MIVLGFDTSATHCAAALYRDGEIVSSQLEEMKRGQAERLMGLLEEVLLESALTWADLDRVGVGVGPGNFTGIRIGVSAARGLALGLKIPAIGVNRFESLQNSTAQTGIPCVLAPQDNVYVQRPNMPPELLSREAAEELEQSLIFETTGFNSAIEVARIAAHRDLDNLQRPAPLYIKSADAAPARDAPPRIIP